MTKRPLLAIIAALALSATFACSSGISGGEDDAELSLSIGRVPESVQGNVVEIPARVKGVDVVAPDGDTSGDTGHFHVFIDKDPVDEGDVIPKERGVVHSAETPIKVWGLKPGEHEFTVVMGDGKHQRIHDALETSVSIDVEGPSVWGIAPATVERGEAFEVELKKQGVDITAADGKHSDDAGHFHVLVDPEEPPVPGKVIPPAKEGAVYHTTEKTVELPGFDEKGDHTIYIVLGDGTHTAFDPAVMDKLTVTVD